MELRPYQLEAVEAVYRHLREREDNPLIVIPTGGGKTPVIATICRDAVQRWNGRVLILAHVKELLEQAAEKLQLIAPDVPSGCTPPACGAVTAATPSRSPDPVRLQARVRSGAGRPHHHRRSPSHSTDGEGMYRQFLADMLVVNRTCVSSA